MATEKDKVTLECELSRPNVDVRWLKVPPSPGVLSLPLPLTVAWQAGTALLGSPGT